MTAILGKQEKKTTINLEQQLQDGTIKGHHQRDALSGIAD